MLQSSVILCGKDLPLIALGSKGDRVVSPGCRVQTLTMTRSTVTLQTRDPERTQ